jgi:hypothetical protein
LEFELDWINSQVKWQHWPHTLAVIDQTCPGSEVWEQALRRHGVKVMYLSQVPRIRGVEYQHLLVIVGRRLFARLQGGARSVRATDYQDLKLLRIPFSRSKDSSAIFVLHES